MRQDLIVLFTSLTAYNKRLLAKEILVNVKNLKVLTHSVTGAKKFVKFVFNHMWNRKAVGEFTLEPNQAK